MLDPSFPSREKATALEQAERETMSLQHLRGLKPGYQKLPIFTQLARLGGLDTVEVLPVRTPDEDPEGVEILLVRRPDGAPFWPGLLHVAGSAIREDDPIENEHDYRPAIGRAMMEMNGVEFIDGPHEIETVHRRGDRSREITVRFWGEATGQPEEGRFYDAAEILRRAAELGITESHAAFIERVAQAYREYRENK